MHSKDATKLEPMPVLTSSGQAYLVPLNTASVPPFLVTYLCRCFNLEVDASNTCEQAAFEWPPISASLTRSRSAQSAHEH